MSDGGSFAHVGILPDQIAAPAPKTRAFFSTGRIAVQYIGTAVMASLGLGIAAMLLFLVPKPWNLLGCGSAILAFAVIILRATRHDYRWIELEGRTLRARHLYTGRTIERSAEDIDALRTMVYPIRTLAVAVVEEALGRIRGIEVRFKDRRTPLRIMRADPAMLNAKALIEAIVFRMNALRPVEAEIVDFRGTPLVRNIHWRGEVVPPFRGNAASVMLACLMFLAMLFGIIMGCMSGAGERELAVTSVPPQVLSLETLIHDGPGANRHVTLTDFQAGGYAYEGDEGRWHEAWVALFPRGGTSAGSEVQVVLETRAVDDERALRQLVASGRITGICSPEKQTHSGAVLGRELERVNPSNPLRAAWVVDQPSRAVSADELHRSLMAAIACYLTVVALALVLLIRRT